jgi:methionyl-tRNA formyltransferase
VAQGIPVIQPTRLKDPDVESTLRDWRLDLGVVAAYGRIIPEHLLSVPRLGMINVHASLLPRYRGAAPVHRAVMAGERETGVTIMRVVKELDAGAMLATVTRPIGPDETSDVVEADLAELGADLLLRVVEQLADGSLVEVPQDAASATYASRLARDEGLIDWSLPARVIHDRVRGLHPWPHAHTILHGARLLVIRTRPMERTSDATPGTVVAVSPEAIRVATGRGELDILTIQPEGRRPMAAREYLAGHPIRMGESFSRA